MCVDNSGDYPQFGGKVVSYPHLRQSKSGKNTKNVENLWRIRQNIEENGSVAYRRVILPKDILTYPHWRIVTCFTWYIVVRIKGSRNHVSCVTGF